MWIMLPLILMQVPAWCRSYTTKAIRFNSLFTFFFLVFPKKRWVWTNSGPLACWLGALQLEPHPQPITEQQWFPTEGTAILLHSVGLQLRPLLLLLLFKVVFYWALQYVKYHASEFWEITCLFLLYWAHTIFQALF